MKYFKLKFLLLFAALAVAIPSAWAATVTDVITAADLEATNSTYKTFSDKSFTSPAVYAGKNAYRSGDIQLRTNNSDAGIVTTGSGGTVASVTIYFANDAKSVDIYGKHTAYSSASDLFDKNDKGILITNVITSKSGVVISIPDDYEYIGIRSNSGATYLTKIEITWDDGAGGPTVAAPTFSYNNATIAGSVQVNQNDVINITSAEGTFISYTTDGTDPAESSTAVMTEDNSAAVTITQDCTIKAIALDADLNQSAETTLDVTVYIPPTPSGIIYEKVAGNTLVKNGKYILVYEGNPAAAMGKIQKISGSGTKGIAVSDILFYDTTTPKQVDLAGKQALTLIAHETGTDGRYAFEFAEGQYLSCDKANLDSVSATDYSASTTAAQWNIDAAGVITNVNATDRVLSYRTNGTFGSYSTSNINNTEYFNAYLYKLVEDEPEMTVALTPAAAEGYTVGDNVTVYATVENGSEETMVTYKVNNGTEQDYDAATGIVLPNDKAGDVVVTVYALDGEKEATDTVAYHFTAAEAFAITLTPDGGEEYTVGDKVNVKVGVENNIGNYTITYSIDRAEETYDPEKGIDIPNDRAGDVTLTVNVADGYDHQGTSSATATYHFNAAPAIEVTLNPASGTYFLDEQATVTVSTLNTIGDAMITYQIGDGEPMDYENGITISAQEAGTVNLTVTVADGYHEGVATATGEYTFVARPVADAPVFSLASGTYGDTQSLQITGANGATIYYTTDGTEPTTESAVYSGAIALGEGKTIVKAIAVIDGMTNSAVANAYYIIEIPEVVTPLTNGAITGFYAVKNNGNEQYIDIRGRKTLTFTNDIDKKPGTVIWIETDENGQVQSLRSQGADLQGYANRAMKYVPEIVELAVEKLHAEGTGEILGANGLDEMMEKFKECFDHHLYVEEATGGYRLYGRTPSMQHVVDFYREHTHQVETKLPRLEEFINSAITKVLQKTGGKGASILKPFSLHQTWQRMDSALVNANLIEPVDSATTMDFYRQVLNDKNYVWQFAYETAMTYWERIKSHPKYETYFKPTLGEFADYIERIEDVHPDFKYYVVQENNKPDYVSQGNKDILENNGRTIWTIESRDSFKVNFSLTEDNQAYYTTLYTDFAYELPEGVKAYIVTAIDGQGNTLTQQVTGTIPAQTPILLKADAAGDQVLTLATAGNADVSGNLLVGADHFINEYKLKTEQVATLFDMAKDILGETFYNNYIAKYEHLMYKNSGTVNNKYFWGLTTDDIYQCIERDENDEGIIVIRSLSNGDNGLGFYDNETAGANQAFLDNYTFNPVKLVVKNDVTRDGIWDIDDVTATISIILGTAEQPNNYNYVAADFNENGTIDIDDVTAMISYILGQ